MLLMDPAIDSVQSRELKIIIGVINENPTICEWVLQDL